MELNKITKGLFDKCLAMSTQKHIVMGSRLPFADGFYVTERDTVLRVCGHTIYRLTEEGWEQASDFIKLWYDSMVDFVDIPAEMVNGLGFEEVSFDDEVQDVAQMIYTYYHEKEKEYERRLGVYFASSESRVLERTGDSPWEISEELYNMAIAQVEEALILKGKKIRISEEIKNALQIKMNVIEADLRTLACKVVKRSWRPLIWLSGKRGEYNDLLYYDEELNLMVVYEPDDNYYHWGGYEYYVGVPTKDRSHYDREKNIKYVHCPVDYDSIEFEYSERNEQRYRVWDGRGKEVFSDWRE
jgi:hypothetical protein